jgi:hypothetical protein
MAPLPLESDRRFVVCVRNDAFPASLELRKIYEVLPDESAERSSWVRVVDESGEDYVYPEDCFVPVELPPSAASALRKLE